MSQSEDTVEFIKKWKRNDEIRHINTRDKTPHNPQSFRPFKYNNQASIQHQFNNYQGHVQDKHRE